MSVFTGISKLNKGEMTALINASSLSLTKGLDTDDQNALGNFLVATGSVMMTFTSLTPPSNTAE